MHHCDLSLGRALSKEEVIEFEKEPTWILRKIWIILWTEKLLIFKGCILVTFLFGLYSSNSNEWISMNCFVVRAWPTEEVITFWARSRSYS